MATPINLNKARKARQRVRKAQKAAENRVKFGRTKTEKARDKQSEQRAEKAHISLKRDDRPTD